MRRLYDLFCFFSWFFLPIEIIMVLWTIELALYIFAWYRESVFVKSNGF